MQKLQIKVKPIPIDIPESVLVSEFFVTGGYKQGTQSGLRETFI
jgi:hypothetical protein